MNGMVRTLWAYRGFILGSVKREFQSRRVRFPAACGAGFSVFAVAHKFVTCATLFKIFTSKNNWLNFLFVR